MGFFPPQADFSPDDTSGERLRRRQSTGACLRSWRYRSHCLSLSECPAYGGGSFCSWPLCLCRRFYKESSVYFRYNHRQKWGGAEKSLLIEYLQTDLRRVMAEVSPARTILQTLSVSLSLLCIVKTDCFKREPPYASIVEIPRVVSSRTSKSTRTVSSAVKTVTLFSTAHWRISCPSLLLAAE